MKFTHKFPVDAGNVGVIDEQYLKDNRGSFKDETLNKRVELPEGKYEISFKCNNTWYDKVDSKIIIETKGSLIFGDLCYLWEDHEAWIQFLDETNYLKNPNEFFATNDTGGDGEFKFNINIKKIE